MTAWQLAGTKGVVARMVSYHLKKKKETETEKALRKKTNTVSSVIVGWLCSSLSPSELRNLKRG